MEGGNIPSFRNRVLQTWPTPATLVPLASFAADFCNVQDPLSTGLPGMMQNLPFVKLATGVYLRLQYTSK
jgi:hypothetical protein